MPPDIQLHAVDNSSQITGYGYDTESNTLAIRFKSHKPEKPEGVYHYDSVPAPVWAEFQKAESKGKFFGSAVKPFYKHTKIQ